MSVKIFLSTVSDEFESYREQLRADLTRPNVDVKDQEYFKALGGETLEMLDDYIASCDAVVHLVGDMAGAAPSERGVRAILEKYPNVGRELPPLGEALANGGVSYTQWEASLALYHRKRLIIAKAADKAEREKATFAPTPESRAAQVAHLKRLEAVERFPGCEFTTRDGLRKFILASAVLDARGGRASRTLCRWRDDALQPRARHSAGDL